MIARLIPRAALVTPNLPKAYRLTDLAGDADMGALATGFLGGGAHAVLLKGGQAGGPQAIDWLMRPDAPPLGYAAVRKPGGDRRGTGCTLASAIAAHLACGHDLPTVCGQAKRFLADWM